MTQQGQIQVDCPKCASKGKVNLHQSINVSLDPGLREKLFNGEINVLHCAEGGHDALISIPLL